MTKAYLYNQDGDIVAETSPNSKKIHRKLKIYYGDADPTTQKVIDGILVDKDISDIEAYTLNIAWRELRAKRTQLLLESDWTQIPDTPVNTESWAEYRQKLRDLPSNTENPLIVEWPTPPKE
jgi:hypothetical protein